MKGCVRSQRPYGDLFDINGLILMKLARVVCWDQGQRSRSQEAKDRFGGVAEALYLTPLGRGASTLLG